MTTRGGTRPNDRPTDPIRQNPAPTNARAEHTPETAA